MRTLRSCRIAVTVAVAILLGLMSPLAAGAQAEFQQLSNHDVARALFERVFNGGDSATAESLLADTAAIETPYGTFTGPQGLQDYLDIINRGYPDASFAVGAIRVQGDAVTIEWTMTATRYQVGPNEPVLNVNVRMPGETIITMADGQIAGMTQSSETAVARAPAEVSVIANGMQWP